MKKFLNKEIFDHTSRHGTRFFANRCDFEGGVKVYASGGISKENLMLDVAEMIGFHATNIWPQLLGFFGYDTIAFNFDNKEIKNKYVCEMHGSIEHMQSIDRLCPSCRKP
ncbi:hypothetical protein A3I18_00155 [Candidatus Campbellbacteria bacterium RIFCSPLOWO2_02_FULL_35_11]|uniref:Uncharacterized protein n=2 Tax=Candidatus Campbelliibacteriota TaxID=1752727 RepID=A0A1F5ENC4_9BACT|nr:MAG: hypothetical protein A3E89_02940 [Candidatus Campbellbacteria bacterium RIFCSPHIGHO2_12_FULL_35_10]OGD70051.1 MAG: hypothetical protein A3I18_00155 [Candidatus Campbellbacteria bacterium RIFCSPLOWO2_02_FULL_35_11]OGH65413.1 MAG: hypothetical protein A3B83_01030 [Candidatus Magasanikbacteria bacterium RIFCSPHIGHO2_02_FULL_33_17]